MHLADIFVGLGEQLFGQLLRGISMGKLKTFQLFDRIKARAHVSKLNSETLRKASPRLWERLQSADEELAQDLAQAILVSHMDMIQAVLNFLSIPHEDGFFAKDLDPKQYLTDGWQQRVFEEFRSRYPEALVLFYINHLDREVNSEAQLFAPAAPAV